MPRYTCYMYYCGRKHNSNSILITFNGKISIVRNSLYIIPDMLSPNYYLYIDQNLDVTRLGRDATFMLSRCSCQDNFRAHFLFVKAAPLNMVKTRYYSALQPKWYHVMADPFLKFVTGMIQYANILISNIRF